MCLYTKKVSDVFPYLLPPKPRHVGLTQASPPASPPTATICAIFGTRGSSGALVASDAHRSAFPASSAFSPAAAPSAASAPADAVGTSSVVFLPAASASVTLTLTVAVTLSS